MLAFVAALQLAAKEHPVPAVVRLAHEMALAVIDEIAPQEDVLRLGLVSGFEEVR